MRAAKVQASLRIRAVSPEPSLLAHTSTESRGTFRQKARSLAPLNGWACAVKMCHDGMLEDTNSLDGAQLIQCNMSYPHWNEVLYAINEITGIVLCKYTWTYVLLKCQLNLSKYICFIFIHLLWFCTEFCLNLSEWVHEQFFFLHFYHLIYMYLVL